MSIDKVTSYLLEAKELFDEWKSAQGTIISDDEKIINVNHKDRFFIRDGVVCPELWFSQEIRPLFLLKEAYGGKNDWDLAKDHLLCNWSISKTWERVSGWAKGLFATTDTYIPDFIKEDPEISRFGNEYLKKIAVVNIKKSNGKTSSCDDEINAYAMFDRERLKKQLEICAPTVIICGYTAYKLEIILNEKFRDTYNDNLFYHIFLNGRDVLVIDYWHPANRYPDIMNYYGLMEIYQRAVKSGN